MAGRGRKAAIPTAEEADRYAEQVTPDPVTGRIVTLYGIEQHPDGLVVDATGWVGPEQVVNETLAALREWCFDGKGLSRAKSVKTARDALKTFLQWADSARLASLAELTGALVGEYTAAEVGGDSYMSWLRDRYAEHSVYGFVARVRSLLLRSPIISEDVRKVCRKRIGGRPTIGDVRVFLTSAEIVDLTAVVVEIIEDCHSRISPYWELVRPDRTDPIPDHLTARWESLDRMLTSPTLIPGPDRKAASYRPLGPMAMSGRRGNVQGARCYLAPTTAEAFAMAIWLGIVMEWNKSVISEVDVPVDHNGQRYQVLLDKPRRKGRRTWWESLSGNNLAIVAKIIESTDPLREHLLRQGRPTDRLLVINGFYRAGAVTFGVPDNDPRSAASWLPDGFRWDVLRLSVRNRVTKEPASHSADEQLQYALRSKEARAEYQQTTRDALEDARAETVATLRARIGDDDGEDVADALIVACENVHRHPVTNRPCRDGFYGFLLCLSCSNAISLPRHLPMQLAALEVLEQVQGSVPGDVWSRRFQDGCWRLQHLVAQRTATEHDKARAQIAPQHYDTLTIAIQRGSR
ncbi:MAG: hypothetical protein HQ526_05640 [Actinobacteria bacterium]|nr:hypothetical protein [Actinomycetota bacterium]